MTGPGVTDAEVCRAAYDEWCKPRMGNLEPDHPSDAFRAGWEAAAELRRGEVPVSELRLVAKRNLHSMIERGSHDKATMLACLEELS